LIPFGERFCEQKFSKSLILLILFEIATAVLDFISMNERKETGVTVAVTCLAEAYSPLTETKKGSFQPFFSVVDAYNTETEKKTRSF
jgi:hypothetical protein